MDREDVLYIYVHTYICVCVCIHTHTQNRILLSQKMNEILTFATTWMDLNGVTAK